MEKVEDEKQQNRTEACLADNPDLLDRWRNPKHSKRPLDTHKYQSKIRGPNGLT